jgi:hypothetical protein
MRLSARRNIEYLLFSLFLWALLIVRFGYVYGTEDQLEFLPYAQYLHNHSLFQHDFFIQELARYPVNERNFFCGLLVPLLPVLEWACLIIHIGASLALVMAWVKINSLFIKNRLLNYLSIVCGFVIFWNWYLGGATFWANTLEADLPAYALAAWGLYCFLKNSPWTALILLVAATLLHALAGVCLSLLVLGAYFLIQLQKKDSQGIRKAILLAAVFLATAGLYIFLLQKEQAPVLSHADYYRIFFPFRYPHHTMPDFFPVKNILFSAVLMTIGLTFFYKTSRFLFYVVGLQLLGFIIYTIGLEGFHSVTIGQSQWFRSSVWEINLCLTAVFALIDRKIEKDWQIPALCYGFAGVFIAVFLMLTIFPSRFPLNKPYDFGQNKYKDPEIEISQMVKDRHIQGLFVLPFNMNAFKFYSGQDSYLDYKACPRKNSSIAEWYRRCGIVYGMDTARSRRGFNAEAAADSFYDNLKDSSLLRFRQEGITHLLTKKEMKSPMLEELLRNRSYFVYQLK